MVLVSLIAALEETRWATAGWGLLQLLSRRCHVLKNLSELNWDQFVPSPTQFMEVWTSVASENLEPFQLVTASAAISVLKF
jgi:hypothetical protein